MTKRIMYILKASSLDICIKKQEACAVLDGLIVALLKDRLMVTCLKPFTLFTANITQIFLFLIANIIYVFESCSVLVLTWS